MIIKVQTQALFHNRRNVAMPKACDYALTGERMLCVGHCFAVYSRDRIPRLRVLSGLARSPFRQGASTRAAFRFKAPSAATENLFCSSEGALRCESIDAGAKAFKREA